VGTHSRALGGKNRPERGGELITIIIKIPNHPHPPTPTHRCTGTLSAWFRREQRIGRQRHICGEREGEGEINREKKRAREQGRERERERKRER
jgi:hypothetical protein